MIEHGDLRPHLLPVKTPWMVAVSAPFLRVHKAADGTLGYITFVGYFRLEDLSAIEPHNSVEFVSEPPDFVATQLEDGAPYRLIRISFKNPIDCKISSAISGREVFCEDDYDWSAVPSALLPNEDIMANLDRCADYQVRTGLSPNPSMYEIKPSLWAKVYSNSEILHHYLIAGKEDYVEILAEDWSWDVGQAVR